MIQSLKNSCLLKGVGLIVLMLCLLSGCSESVNSERNYYALNVDRPDLPKSSPSAIYLDVRRFAVDAVFATKGLVYRQGQLEYEMDYYNELIVSPAQILTDKTRNWLAESGLFERVLDAGSIMSPTHCLEANVIAMYGDFRDKAAPRAVVEARFFLIQKKATSDSILLNKTYQVDAPMSIFNAKGVVSGYSFCLNKILTRLESDLAAAIHDKAK